MDRRQFFKGLAAVGTAAFLPAPALATGGEFDFGTKDFTVEGWYRFPRVAGKMELDAITALDMRIGQSFTVEQLFDDGRVNRFCNLVVKKISIKDIYRDTVEIEFLEEPPAIIEPSPFRKEVISEFRATSPIVARKRLAPV